MPLSAHGGAFRSKDPIKRRDGSAGTAAHAHTETNNVLTPWSTRSSFPPPWKAKVHMAIYMWSKFCDPGAIPGNTTPQQRKQRFLFIIKASYKERTSAAKRLRVCLRVVRRYAHLVLIIYVCLCLFLLGLVEMEASGGGRKRRRQNQSKLSWTRGRHTEAYNTSL